MVITRKGHKIFSEQFSTSNECCSVDSIHYCYCRRFHNPTVDKLMMYERFTSVSIAGEQVCVAVRLKSDLSNVVVKSLDSISNKINN